MSEGLSRTDLTRIPRGPEDVACPAKRMLLPPGTCEHEAKGWLQSGRREAHRCAGEACPNWRPVWGEGAPSRPEPVERPGPIRPPAPPPQAPKAAPKTPALTPASVRTAPRPTATQKPTKAPDKGRARVRATAHPPPGGHSARRGPALLARFLWGLLGGRR